MGGILRTLTAQRSYRSGTINPIDQKIHHEQIRLIYNQGPALVVGAALCAVMITWFLWSHLPRSTLLYWLGAVLVTSALRTMVIRSYINAPEERRRRSYWGAMFWLGTLFAGIVWGTWPLLFYDLYRTEYLLLISTIFAGMVAVSAASGSIYLPSFLSFSVPLVTPLAITHLLSGSDLLGLTGVLILMFLGVNGFLAAQGNRQYRELIRARFENQALMESLEQEKVIAERAVIAKSRFLAAASHDLRQPLHAMGLFLSALRSRETDQRQLGIINDMTKSTEALNGLFNSLLDVSRLDADIIEFNPTHLPVSDVFEGLRAQFAHQALEKGIELDIQHTSGCVLHTDSILFERVLRNLLSNAIQYTETGFVRLRCKPETDGYSTVTLSDSGIGIPDHEREDVFSEYYQLNNPERDRSKGLGLGLAIVRRLCELMNVPLSMESEVGHGTSFYLRVAQGEADRVSDRIEEVPVAERTDRRVLVIDDEQQVLQSMNHMLTDWGCEVMLAESGRDALKQLSVDDVVPDIIFSDYRLRDNQTGVDAIAMIRESIGEDVPSVVITGDTSPERLKEVTASNLSLLHKPVTPGELRRVLDQLTQVRHNNASPDGDANQIVSALTG